MAGTCYINANGSQGTGEPVLLILELVCPVHLQDHF